MFITYSLLKSSPMSDTLKDRKVCVGSVLWASLLMVKSVSVSSLAAAWRKP